MIHNSQKALIHIYKNAAQLPEQTYRDLLLRIAGVPSAADRRFSQGAFDHVMAALETVLFQRVHARQVPDPRRSVRRIGKEYYWRERCPATGYANSRQVNRIMQLWTQLTEFLPDGQCAPDYLARVVHKATGRHVPGLQHLKSNEAGHIIDALKDRLSYAIKQQPSEETAHNDPLHA